MVLVLEIEFLLGTCFAARDRSEIDWPPQPDRIFSALTATWAGGDEAGRAALTWLEAQEPPLIQASGYHQRPAVDVYVPVNDVVSLPERRERHARRFPAAVPKDPVMRLIWNAEPPPDLLLALQHLAFDTAAIGHSASLTRCRFLIQPAAEALARAPALPARPARRRVHPGRLRELEQAFARGQRPPPATRLPPAAPLQDDPSRAPPRSVFGQDWIVLPTIPEQQGLPHLLDAALFTHCLRRAILSSFGDRPIPPEISGHEPDSTPLDRPHLAIVPMGFVGFAHAEGSLMGLALVLPRAIEQGLRIQGFDPQAARIVDILQAALNGLRQSGTDGAPQIQLHAPGRSAGTASLRLSLDPGERPAASLQPARWCRASRIWASATPVVLDRHLKAPEDSAERAEEIQEQLIQACRNIGLPAPLRVVPHKHAAVTGAPSARRSARGQPWSDWTMPEKYRSRWKTHVVIEFEAPVQGPVILGAARYLGLGLCLPLPDPEQEREETGE